MNPHDGTVLTDEEARRALGETREQAIAQSILTPMPWGTHDAGKVGPILPIEQARDVIAWHERHRQRCTELSAFGFAITRWVSREEAEFIYPAKEAHHEVAAHL